MSFFWFFVGDYWIIDLGKDYKHAVIGHPKRTYLWILGRTKEMDAAVYEGTLSRLQDEQYDTSKLIRTGVDMKLKEYFESREGKGIFSSANSDGMVTSAIYSKPHVFDDGTIALVMRKRLTYENLKTNPYASYMFIEEGHGYKGIRLFLKKIKEDTDSELIDKMKRQYLTPQEDKAKGPKFLMHFRVDTILPLIGEGDTGIEIK